VKDGHDTKTGDRRGGKDLGEAVAGTEDNSMPPAVRHSYQRAAAKSRGNTQDAGRVPSRQSWTGRSERRRMWKEPDDDELEQTGYDAEPKRRWEKSGLAWIKKNDVQSPWNYAARPGDDRSESKRRWKNSFPGDGGRTFQSEVE